MSYVLYAREDAGINIPLNNGAFLELRPKVRYSVVSNDTGEPDKIVREIADRLLEDGVLRKEKRDEVPTESEKEKAEVKEPKEEKSEPKEKVETK